MTADLKRLRRELRQKRELQRQLERQLEKEEESTAEPAAKVEQGTTELDHPKEPSAPVNAFSSLREAAGKYVRRIRRPAAEVSDASSDESGPLLSTWQPDKHVNGLHVDAHRTCMALPKVHVRNVDISQLAAVKSQADKVALRSTAFCSFDVENMWSQGSDPFWQITGDR